MPRLSLFVSLPVIALALTACSDGRQAYYQTRTTPTSTNDAYGMTAQMTWGDNSGQIYELPVQVPDTAGEGYVRKDCQRPGPQFKPITLVAWGDGPQRANPDPQTQPLVGMKLDIPEGDQYERHRIPVASSRARIDKPGINQPAYGARIVATDLRPASTTGAGTEEHEVGRVVSHNNRYNPYCDRPESDVTLPVDAWPGEGATSDLHQPANTK